MGATANHHEAEAGGPEWRNAHPNAQCKGPRIKVLASLSLKSDCLAWFSKRQPLDLNPTNG